MTPLPQTRDSLIARLAEPTDVAAWDEFTQAYEPAIYRFCRARGLQEADAADALQDVLLAVHQVVGSWKPSGREGSFRAWLFETARRVCITVLRKRQRVSQGIGGTGVLEQMQDVAEHSGPADCDDAEWQRWAFCWAAAQVEREVQAETWRAFWLTVVDGAAPAAVAEQLGMSLGGVYTAKCRVLARVKERVQELSR